MLRKIIDFIAGRIGLQSFFERLFRAGLYGMNYGNGGNFKISGEKFAASYIQKALADVPLITVFDVGANKGFYSKELIDIFSNSKFIIHAFEPSQATFNVLGQTLQNESNIILNNFGLGEKTEQLKLYTNNPLSGLASVYQRQLDHIGISMSIAEEISIRTIDDYCGENKIDHIHFLKMDIEGHELKCLSGGSTMLKQKNIDFIQFEFGGCNIDSRTFFQDFWYLLKDDYKIYRIVKNGLVEIKNYNERYEIFKNINFLAELKK